jgi:hypothetical protein
LRHGGCEDGEHDAGKKPKKIILHLDARTATTRKAPIGGACFLKADFFSTL